MYCESCGKENLDYWIELDDGTICCSDDCYEDWKTSLKEWLNTEKHKM